VCIHLAYLDLSFKCYILVRFSVSGLLSVWQFFETIEVCIQIVSEQCCVTT
jgi:hypothetical protein